MNPASSSARTRRRQGGAEIPARAARSTLVIRPLACKSRRIRRSTRSSLIRRMSLSPYFGAFAQLYYTIGSAPRWLPPWAHGDERPPTPRLAAGALALLGGDRRQDRHGDAMRRPGRGDGIAARGERLTTRAP